MAKLIIIVALLGFGVVGFQRGISALAWSSAVH